MDSEDRKEEEEEEEVSSSSINPPLQQQQQQQHQEQQPWRQQLGDQKQASPSSSSSSPSGTLSRSSSLNAKAPEFVPKGAPSPPPLMHNPPIPLMMMPAGHPPFMAPPHPVIAGPVQPPVFVHGAHPPPHSLEARIMHLHMQAGRPIAAPPPFLMPMPPAALSRPLHLPEPYPAQPVGIGDDAASSAPNFDQNVASNSNSKAVLADDLKAMIVKQVEFYLSDTNLLTDDYLVKFIRKDPEGFVPIPIVASLRKVKMLINKNYSLLATALRSSTELVVSDDGKKVRRLHPWPEVDLEEVQSRTVVAENLPPDHSINELEKLFGTVGNVKMVRICEPEAVNGSSQTAAKYPKTDMLVSNKLHALVEYECVEMAEKAVSELTDGRNWRSGLHVRLLLRRTFHNKHGHQQPSAMKGRRSSTGGGDDSGGEDETQAVVGGLSEKCGEEVVHGVEKAEDILGNSGHFSEKDGARRGRARGRGRGRGRGQHYANNGRTHPVGASTYLSGNTSLEMKPPPGPRMPDGSRGFTMGRGKLSMENAI